MHSTKRFASALSVHLFLINFARYQTSPLQSYHCDPTNLSFIWQGLVIIRGTYVNDIEAAFVRLYLLTFLMTFVFCNHGAAIIKDNADLGAFGRSWCGSTFIHKQAPDDVCRFNDLPAAERLDIDAVATQDLNQMPPDESLSASDDGATHDRETRHDPAQTSAGQARNRPVARYRAKRNCLESRRRRRCWL